MRFLRIFWKTLVELAREPWLLTLTVLIAPLFVLSYRAFYPSGSMTYDVLVWNRDAGAPAAAGVPLRAGDGVIRAMRMVTYANGDPILTVTEVSDRAGAEKMLRNRDADALFILPPDLSQVIQSARPGETATTSLTLVGDLTNPYYAVAAALAGGAADLYIQAATGQPRPVQIAEEAIGGSGARSEFENFVPGLLVISVTLLVFPVPMAVAREVEGQTLRRLQLTRMTSWELLGGISAAHVLLGVASVVLAILSAWALGFRSQGPLWVALAIGAVAALAVVGAGLVVAAFSRTVTEAFLIANLPLMLLMFFSGGAFPVPRVALFSVAGRSIALNDLLPLTHAVAALNKVLTLGAGFGEVAYELIALLVLSLLYFAVGVWLFGKMRLKR